MNKAPILSDEQIQEIADPYALRPNYAESLLAQAQRDADHEFYTARIREIFEAIDTEDHKAVGTYYFSYARGKWHECSWYEELKARFLEGEHSALTDEEREIVDREYKAGCEQLRQWYAEGKLSGGEHANP